MHRKQIHIFVVSIRVYSVVFVQLLVLKSGPFLISFETRKTQPELRRQSTTPPQPIHTDQEGRKDRVWKNSGEMPESKRRASLPPVQSYENTHGEMNRFLMAKTTREMRVVLKYYLN